MAYELSWFDDNKRIIFIRVTGIFTLEESQSSSVKIREFIAEGTPPVHLIGDLRGLEQPPFRISDIRNTQGNLSQLATTIIVGNKNPIIHFMASVLSKLGGYEVRIVKDFDEAKIVLARLDPTLGDLASGASSS